MRGASRRQAVATGAHRYAAGFKGLAVRALKEEVERRKEGRGAGEALAHVREQLEELRRVLVEQARQALLERAELLDDVLQV